MPPSRSSASEKSAEDTQSDMPTILNPLLSAKIEEVDNLLVGNKSTSTAGRTSAQSPVPESISSSI